MLTRTLSCVGAGAVAAVLVASSTSPAQAVTPAVGLGVAQSYAVLAGSTVTNTGSSVVNGDLGLSGTTPVPVSGFPPGVLNGVTYDRDQAAADAQSALTTAYVDASSRIPPDESGVDLALGNRVLLPGVYRASDEMDLTGTVTLDAQGDPAAVFLFQAGSTLITASSSTVSLVNGAQPCNVFWQVGSSATLGTSTTFAGTVMAQASISLNDAASVQGRLLARTGAVTLINNVITRPTCAAATTPPTTAPSATATPSATPSTGPSPTRTSRPGRPGRDDTASASGSEDRGGSDGGTDGGSDDGGSSDGGSDDGTVVPLGRPDTGVGPAAAATTSGPGQVWLWGALALLAGAAAYPVTSVLRRPRHRAKHA